MSASCASKQGERWTGRLSTSDVACSAASRTSSVVCLDGMLFHGDADMRANAGGVHSTTAQYVGFTLGIAGW